MKCIRCSGLMIYEKIYFMTEYFWAFKCIYCGEYVDEMIFKNRQSQNLNCKKDGKEAGPFKMY